jgi:SecD/SecF fusion protein
VASGTYSSIFIAAPVLTHWKERETVWRRREKIVLEDHGGYVPAYADTSLGDDTAPAQTPRRAGRRKQAPAEAEPAVAEPAVAESAVAVEEAPGEQPVQQSEPEALPKPATTMPRARTPEERRAVRRAARAAELGTGDAQPKETTDGTADGANKKPKRPAPRRKHGRSR